MQGVLQSSAFARRGGILQPTHEAPSQRFVPLNCFNLWFIYLYLLIIQDEIQIPSVSVLSPEGLDPLRYQQDCSQKYVLNERGETNLRVQY